MAYEMSTRDRTGRAPHVGGLPAAVAVCALAASSCAPVEEAPAAVSVARAELSAAERRARATIIRDAAAARGLTNGVLLGGIADSETGMAHCWSEATWACQGPHAADCGGPVIAGSGDGPCSHRQGGLGMFQFDAGTYDDTLAREGDRVLSIAGNTDAAVDFVISMVTRSTFISGVDTAAQALAWMNEVRVGGTHWDDWITTVTAYYNGCWPGSCSVYSSRYDRYASHTADILGEMGEAFWYPPRCEAHCEGDEIVGEDCGRGDCAAFGSGCVDDELGVRCVFYACPATGTTDMCFADSMLGSCVDGALVSQGDCSAFAALCTEAGGQPPHCASVFCVSSATEVPVERDVCLTDGQRYHCDATGELAPAECPSGQRCSVWPDVHCEPDLPCPESVEATVCSDDALVRCMEGGIVELLRDCSLEGGVCSAATGEPACVAAPCVERPGGALVEGDVCLPGGTIGLCTADGQIVDERPCSTGATCAQEGDGVACVAGEPPDGATDLVPGEDPRDPSTPGGSLDQGSLSGLQGTCTAAGVRPLGGLHRLFATLVALL